MKVKTDLPTGPAFFDYDPERVLHPAIVLDHCEARAVETITPTEALDELTWLYCRLQDIKREATNVLDADGDADKNGWDILDAIEKTLGFTLISQRGD